MGRDRLLPALILIVLLAGGCSNDQGGPENKAGTNSGTDDGEAQLKVAVLFPGRVNDQAFNQAGYEALQAAKEKHNLDTAYSESVPAAQYESTMRSYAQQGFDLVIGDGFQFIDAAKAAAVDFPDTKFVVNGGDVSAPPNLASVNFADWQAGYLAGVVAGSITEADKIAYMGGIPIPPIAQFGNAFKLGAESVNPDVEVLATYTGSFDDVAKAKETAAALIDQGADVISANANVEGPAAIETAAEKGVLAIGALFNATGVAPDTVVATGVVKFGVGLGLIIDEVVNGNFEPKSFLFGISEGVIDLEWNPAFQSQFADVQAAVDEAKADLMAGKVEAPSTQP